MNRKKTGKPECRMSEEEVALHYLVLAMPVLAVIVSVGFHIYSGCPFTFEDGLLMMCDALTAFIIWVRVRKRLRAFWKARRIALDRAE